METFDLISLLKDYGIFAYALIIFFGGRFGLKYFILFEKTKYNFLLFATVFAMLFIAGEVLSGVFEWESFIKYLLTYAVVTSCYEALEDYLPFIRPKQIPDEKP